MRIAGRLGRREVRLTVVITAYEWERLLEWQFQDSYGVRGKQRWELHRCRREDAAHDARFLRMPSLFGRMFDRIFTRFAVAQRDRGWLARLQHLAERR